MERNTKLAIVILPVLAAVAAIVFLPPLAQPLAYHDFADRRASFGMSNCGDVVSNLAFLVAGLMGAAWLLDRCAAMRAFGDTREHWPYLCFFLGVALTAFGSTWYHLAPDNLRLLWDRLPITLSLAALLAATVSDRVSARAGLALLAPLLLLAAGSALYWRSSMIAGAENLLPYVAVQAYAMLAVLLIAVLFPSRYSRGADIYAVLGFYAVAKVAEGLDRPIFEAVRIVSGHTLKHLLAALAVFWVLRMLRTRRSLLSS